jgi:beta-aspartyl-dipeptidase (metallo-type)
LAPLRALRDGTDIPLRQLYPTHCNRNPWLFAEAIEWGRAGGWVDLTTSSFPDLLDDGERLAADALVELLAAGCPPIASASARTPTPACRALMARASHRAALRPDRQPVAGAGGELRQGVALEVALAVVTANPARALGLATKGMLGWGRMRICC